ncbi:hypothetical protein Cgig2_026657 [Carnegiea gigantea]|uniref:6-phosphofructo-2-kinase domain-containing protein n=1 Tax=Carnegiea gigantea TaxID=171969 RepID=A0A9Q1JVD2_9CARY|nr:hypothetical protein Cgig2_026657 [Carnegiea gigantea]
MFLPISRSKFIEILLVFEFGFDCFIETMASENIGNVFSCRLMRACELRQAERRARSLKFKLGKLVNESFLGGSDPSPSNRKFCELAVGQAAQGKSADFFRADNPEGIEARNEQGTVDMFRYSKFLLTRSNTDAKIFGFILIWGILLCETEMQTKGMIANLLLEIVLEAPSPDVAALAMEDMISWMQGGGQVGIFDATNSSRQRRNMLMKMAEGKCKVTSCFIWV